MYVPGLYRPSLTMLSLLSFRKRAAQRNLLALSLSALGQGSDTAEFVLLKVSMIGDRAKEVQHKQVHGHRFIDARPSGIRSNPAWIEPGMRSNKDVRKKTPTLSF